MRSQGCDRQFRGDAGRSLCTGRGPIAGRGPYVRTVQALRGDGDDRVIDARGSRRVEHLGPPHTDTEVLLKGVGVVEGGGEAEALGMAGRRSAAVLPMAWSVGVDSRDIATVAISVAGC